VSRYPWQYISASKGAINIEDMPTPHLANAWRSIATDIIEDETDYVSRTRRRELLAMRDAMMSELVSRGCWWDAVTLSWTFPQKPDVDPEGT